MNASQESIRPQLSGYTLVSRLGAGGYGEVWLATAPGGLTKAVKFIYGSFHEKRAEHELRALQRIKEVRHPFLLSLERIEVADGRLAVVSELAESSLKDRFDACQRERLPGIPRGELLRYLRDAADALDFISDKHSLQHLDVKPENLLLVAGHVKVADFGLVKDVGNSQASLVGGLTPLYSAPEVFQGSPTSHSDQYSLAVLYQEMLTGVLPFEGATAAELTLQHLNDEPNLSPLPTTDRYVLARALAKDPVHRYASCSELIQALMDAGSAAGQAWGDQQSSDEFAQASDADADGAPRRRPGPVTELFEEGIEPRAKEVTPSMLLDWTPPAAAAPVCLPPLDVAGDGFCPQPTLVIGIGGAAGSVLKQLRARIAQEYDGGPLPAVQMLLLDSDAKSIARAMQGDSRGALTPEETITLPLRRPQDYREQSGKLIRWLSRRWLYNIPRSLRTEGLRPLGRLALADHSRQVIQRIRLTLARATDAEALEQTSARTGLKFQAQTPRVYVVASISGGTGSGMSLDVGYAIRTVLEKAGSANAQVIGVLLHSTGKDPRHCDLAKVNAYAWLSEYNHFHGPDGHFPGDESCGLPSQPVGCRAFDSAYLVDLGVELDDQALDAATRSVAEYLYLDALTPAQQFFDACRRQVGPDVNGGAPLRTFALRRVAAIAEESIKQAASSLSRAVVLRWSGVIEQPTSSGGSSPAAGPASLRDTNQVVQGATVLVNQLQLNLEGMASAARGLIEAQFGDDLPAYVDALTDPPRPDGRPQTAQDMMRAVNGVFATTGDEGSHPCILLRPLDSVVSPLAMRVAGDLARWVLGKLDDRQERLAGAQRAAAWLADYLQRVDADAQRLAAGISRQIADAAEQLRRETRGGAEASQQALAYFRLRIDHHAVWASGSISRRLLAEMKSIGATVAEFGRHLKHVAHGLKAAETPASVDALIDRLLANVGGLSEAVDHQIQEQFIGPCGGLFQTIMGNSRVRGQLLGELGKLCQRAVEQLAARPEVQQAALAAVEGAASGAGGGSEESPTPKLLQFGGTYRTLAVAPDAAVATRVASTWAGAEGHEPSLLGGVGRDVTLCYEGWDLPLRQIAVELIQRRRDYADFAGRVRTRNDISWTPLLAPRAPAVSGDVDESAAIVTCVL